MTEASVRTELATAARRVGAAYNALPESDRPDVSFGSWDKLLDSALESGDHDRAMRAIEAWRDHHLALIEGAAK